MENLLIIVVLAGIAWFWLDALRARESAIAAAGRACIQVNVQLLDHTVAVEKMGFARKSSGQLVLKRIYGFEYSAEGVERRKGRVILRGQALEQVQLDTDNGTTIEQHEG